MVFFSHDMASFMVCLFHEPNIIASVLSLFILAPDASQYLLISCRYCCMLFSSVIMRVISSAYATTFLYWFLFIRYPLAFLFVCSLSSSLLAAIMKRSMLKGHPCLTVSRGDFTVIQVSMSGVFGLELLEFAI